MKRTLFAVVLMAAVSAAGAWGPAQLHADALKADGGVNDGPDPVVNVTIVNPDCHGAASIADVAGWPQDFPGLIDDFAACVYTEINYRVRPSATNYAIKDGELSAALAAAGLLTATACNDETLCAQKRDNWCRDNNHEGGRSSSISAGGQCDIVCKDGTRARVYCYRKLGRYDV